MKHIIVFLKYYTYGFLIATMIGIIIFLYGLWFDEAYLFYDSILHLKVTSIMAVPSGLHLFIMKYIDQPQQIKNKNLRRFYTIFASYWIGVIFSIVILCLLQSLSNFIMIPYSYCLTDDNLLDWSLVGGVGFGVFFIKKYSYIS